MEHRDRSSGWRHAKLSGHENENLVKNLLDTDKAYANEFVSRIGFPNDEITRTSIGGLHETDVLSVNGTRKTKSKTDLKVYLNSDKVANISVKKSLGGQVYFVRAGLFVDTFEQQFDEKIPDFVQRAIDLFWANADDAIGIIEKYADRCNKNNYARQIKHKSLNADTLKNYDEDLYNSLLVWFTDNTFRIAKLCFSTGAVADKKEWADFVWYKNMLAENDIDAIFPIADICEAAQSVAKSKTYFGCSNGGTTIQLPFGFVQWHQRQLQFHHSYNKIAELLK